MLLVEMRVFLNECQGFVNVVCVQKNIVRKTWYPPHSKGFALLPILCSCISWKHMPRFDCLRLSSLLLTYFSHLITSYHVLYQSHRHNDAQDEWPLGLTRSKFHQHRTMEERVAAAEFYIRRSLQTDGGTDAGSLILYLMSHLSFV